MSLPFTQLALHQPFFITEPVTRLVYECEANLEVLFPLEAEVIESASVEQKDTKKKTKADLPSASLGTRTPLGEETIDVYKSTLAAIKAIQCLKKASSTSNPLSLSYIFGNQDNNIAGAVTAENSPCDSLVSVSKGEDTYEDAHSPM